MDRRQLRKKLGLTMDQVAAEVGTTKATVSKIETGAAPQSPFIPLIDAYLEEQRKERLHELIDVEPMKQTTATGG